MMDDKLRDAIAKTAENGDLVQLSALLSTPTAHCVVTGIVPCERCFTESNTALSEASRNGHLNCVQKLLEMEVNYCLDKYRFAIEIAAIGGHTECFRFLMITRLFKSLSGIQEYEVFIHASKEGNFSRVCELFIAADENIIAGWKSLCLMNLFIVYGAPTSCLQVLIDRGVCVSQFDYNGLSPLMCAVLSRNINAVCFLLQIGVKVNIPSIYMDCEFLPNGTTIPGRPYIHYSDRQTTALMYAASCSTHCLRELLWFLVQEDVNFVNKMNRSALTYAAYYGNAESVSLLIKAGARVDLIDYSDHFFYEKFNIPQHAMAARKADSLEQLLQVASRDCLQYTISNVAVCAHDANCLRVLLKCDVDNIDVIPYDEVHFHRTLLMQAAWKGCIESVCLLLEHGAGVNVRNCYGETALMFSCHDQRENVLDLLIDRGADIDVQNYEGNSVIMYMAINNSLSCLHKLISHGVSIHVRNNSGETPLMLACMYGHHEFVEALLNYGADVKAQNMTGDTASSYAYRHGREKCVELLLAAGADLDIDRGKGLAMSLSSMTVVYCGNVYSCEAGLLDSDRDEISIFKTVKKDYISVNERTSLAMKLEFFDWDWCLRPFYQDNEDLDQMVSSAVFSGVCPSRFVGKYPRDNVAEFISDGLQLSPLFMSLLQMDSVNLLKYILANRFFFPEEYQVLISNEPMCSYCWLTQHYSPGRGDIYFKLTHETLSLKTWAFLTVSKAISLGGHPGGRPGRVDALPVSDSVKRALKFKTSISHLAPDDWDSLSIDEVFDSLNFRKEIMWRWDNSYSYNCGIFDRCDKLVSKFVLPQNHLAVTCD